MTNTTDTASVEDGILKQDRLGRVRTPVKRQEALLEEYDRSGMSGAEYAQYIGVKYTTFATWIQKREKRRAGVIALPDSKEGRNGKPMRWVEATLEARPEEACGNASVLMVHMAGGGRMEISNARQAALAVEVLRGLRI